jgi:RNA polymerase sigma factor (sigma-70 family)
MTQSASRSVVRQIESLFDGGSVSGLSDRQLIDRFNASKDVAGEAAFAAIVRRHGPMVLDVCRQIVGDAHHAEDAFQAVFLVLAIKAGAIRDPDLLGTWLYGVTIRTARRSRARLVRLRRREEGDAMRCPGPDSRVLAGSPVESAEESAIGREQAEALHDEIDRLPQSFRLPVVLSYFEGLTLDEVARRLHWPAGTVRSRLARARDKLRRVRVLRPVRHHDQGRAPIRRRTGRLGLRLGPGPGGTPIHAASSTRDRRADRAHPRRRHRRRGSPGPIPDVEGRAQSGRSRSQGDRDGPRPAR